MKPYYLALFLYFAENAYFILMSDALQSKTANWAHIAVRKPLNASIIAMTFNTDSLIGCATVCTKSRKIEMAPSFNFEQDHGRCHCNNALDDTAEDPDEPEVTYGILKQYEDCHAYYMDGYKDYRLYNIQPLRNGPTKRVFCYMEPGLHVGWTYIQLRTGARNDILLNRSWTDYVNGFADRQFHWIGLESLHHLTKRSTVLRIDMGLPSEYAYVLVRYYYLNFTIGNVASNFTLHVSGLGGKGGDSLSSHNGMPFSVPNGDNECADACAGGWWYRRDGSCGQAILNRMTFVNPQCPIWATSEYNFYNKTPDVWMMVTPFGD